MSLSILEQKDASASISEKDSRQAMTKKKDNKSGKSYAIDDWIGPSDKP